MGYAPLCFPEPAGRGRGGRRTSGLRRAGTPSLPAPSVTAGRPLLLRVSSVKWEGSDAPSCISKSGGEILSTSLGVVAAVDSQWLQGHSEDILH